MEKILIVEDDQEVRENLVEILQLNDYHVLEAHNGLHALEVVKNSKPDLIISDIMMPKMDGHDFIKEMQRDENTSTIPFIFLSAKINSIDIRQGMTLGADDYITKPYETNDLLSAIKTRLNKSNAFAEKVKKISENISITVPHEMRTPLVSILGVSGLIADDHENMKKEEVINLVRQINNTGKRLHKTIEKFLVYYDINLLSSFKEYSYQSSSMNHTEIENIIDSLKLKYNRNNCRGRSVDYQFENCIVDFASYHLEFVLEELLCNGCKFSKEDTFVKLKGYINKDKYTIEISDCGVGMTDSQINSIRAFNQFDKEKLNQKGSGLGLATVIKILNHYGSDLNIESSLNEYTIATINIPIVKKKYKVINNIDSGLLVN